MRLFLASIALGLLATLPAHAEHAVPAEMTAEDRIEVTRVEDYLNGVTTLKAGFTQLAGNGESSGTFYLSRPGHLRFDYAEPTKDIIVADGKFIWYYDSKLKDANHAPLSRTMADFLLRPHIELTGGDVTITDYRRDTGTVTLTLTQTSDPDAGSLTLSLADKPLRIAQWRVIDNQGHTTQIRLSTVQTGVTLDPQLFVWHDPETK